MVKKRKSQKKRSVNERVLADKLKIGWPVTATALPYYTRDGGDTEYLLSNPNASVVSGLLAVFGKRCRLLERKKFKIKPHCTARFRMRVQSPDHAGHAIVAADGQLVMHLLYMTQQGMLVNGGELAGRDNLFQWRRNEKSRTYGFGYRSSALGHDEMDGAVFVSNPHNQGMSGKVAFLDEKCSLAQAKGFRIRPGCTTAFKFPKNTYGYGRIKVSSQAVINVLHFTKSAKGLAAAELVGESNLLDAPADLPGLKKKILFDDTHGCRPGIVGDWTEYETALNNAGYPVAHYTASSVTLAALKKHDAFVITVPRVNYTSAEKTAIVDFVNDGGGLMIVQDFGNAPWSAPTREILNLFGANDDNNFMEDPTNHYLPGQYDDVVFDSQRNFLSHPIVNGWNSFHVDAASSLSADGAWTTVVETDDDSIPARRPAVIARAFGSGRVVAFGDSNTWADHHINHLDNRVFGVRCAEWILFRI